MGSRPPGSGVRAAVVSAEPRFDLVRTGTCTLSHHTTFIPDKLLSDKLLLSPSTWSDCC